MKKRLGLLMALLFVAGNLYAGSVDYLSNQSAKYFMTLSRNASTDASADIVHYNPAGTAFLAPGLYFDISNQSLDKPYSTDSNTTMGPKNATYGSGVLDKNLSFKQSNDTYLLPDAYLAYNFGQVGMGKLAVYGQFGIVAGGGDVVWNNGTAGSTFALSALASSIWLTAFQGAMAATGNNVALSQGIANTNAPGDISSQKFQASSVYYGGAVGASYSLLNDMVSVSLGGRIVMANRSLKLDATFSSGTSIAAEYSYDATGFTPIVGLDIKPVNGLTIAARYEGETGLKFKYKQKTFDISGGTTTQQTNLNTGATALLTNSGIADGNTFNYDLPQILSLGVEYAVTPALSVMTSANFYFLGQSDMGKVYNSEDNSVVQNQNKYFGTGYELAFGATFKVIPDLKIGAGFMYTKSGAKDSYFNNQYTSLIASANPPLDSWAIGCGATYNVMTNLDLTLSGLYTHYLPFNYTITSQGLKTPSAVSGASGTYKKDIIALGVGVGFKM